MLENKNKGSGLSVNVVTPEGAQSFNKIQSITSETDEGIFDILPQHAQFISIIKNYVLLQLESGEEERIENFTTGVVRVFDNKVDIYLDIEYVPS